MTRLPNGPAPWILLLLLAAAWGDAAAPGAPGRGASSPIVWGVNGHPLAAYRSLPIEAQLDLVKALGFASYRVDLYGTGQMDAVEALVEQGRRRGVTILPILIPDPMKASDERDAYDMGFAIAHDYALRFRGRVPAWELGNEYDNAVGMSFDGADPAQFPASRYFKARGAIRGMLDGIHAADPVALRAVDNAGWCHYGFLRRLRDDGVEWDITAQHWYSGQGDMERAACGCGAAASALRLCRTNILEILKGFGRPIWITEFNDNSPPSPEKPRAAAVWLVGQMARFSAVAARYGITAAHVYELLDQPELEGGEGFYGIANPDGSLKPAAEAISAFLRAF